jgi:hypothetical protein
MKYGAGGSLFQIAVAAIEITILMSRTKNVPTRAFRAFPKRVEIAKERDIAVLIQTIKRMIMGPGLMDTISRRKAAATRRKIDIAIVAERRKSR